MMNSKPPKPNQYQLYGIFFPNAPFHFGTSLFLSFMRSSALPLKMDHPNFSFFRTFLQIIFLTTLTNETLSLDLQFEACSPRSCGNGPNISYPFWIAHEQESFCGYPNFGITCKEDYPVLTISDYDYIVKDIFYSDYLFRVVDSVVSEKICPAPLRNVSLDSTPFYLSPDNVDFLFLYNCSESRPDYLTYPVSCTSNASDYSFAVFHKEAFENLNYSLESCLSFVNAPVDMDAHSNFSSLLSMNYTEILKMGFLMNWTAHSCSDCESSGGRCGFDNNQFICFCKDRPHSKTCNDDDGPSWARKLGIGFGSGVGGIALTCAIFMFYLRCKRKQKYDQPSPLSRGISFDSSSVMDPEKGDSLPGVHQYTYKELEEATNKFDSNKELGDGGFGTVYYGKLKDGRAVAVKRLYENNYKRVEQFWNEVVILARLRHKNLVSLYGYTSRHSRELLLVYEFISNGTVADHLHGDHAKPGALPWSTRLKIAIETANALTYLHACDIIHRDVKTNNILLDENFCVKVADFGLSRLFPTDVTHVSTAPQGTPGYVDPEYHECYHLTDKSDVFSFGVVLMELISSKPAVDITRHRHEINLSTMAINKIQNGALHELVDPYLGFESDYKTRKMIYAVAEVAFKCLQSGKDMRPTMGEVLEALKDIQNEDYSKETSQVADTPADEAVLLKNGPQTLSPDSVTLQWISGSSTSNASN